MKAYFAFVVTAVVLAAAAGKVGQTRFERGLLKMIQKCIDGDVKSLPIKLPSLRPLILSPMSIEYAGYTLELSEATVQGLKTLSVDGLSASKSDLTVSLTFSVPGRLVGTAAKYHLYGETLLGLGLATIDDRGVFTATVDNLKARADIQFAGSGSNTVIKYMDIVLTVDDAKVSLSGSSEFVNDVINARLVDVINDGDGELIDRMKRDIKQMASKTLQGYTPDKLIKIISDYSSSLHRFPRH